MNKKITLECNDSGCSAIMGVLKHLEKLSTSETSRVIRIGGDERLFNGASDKISSIELDGVLNTDEYISVGKLHKDACQPVSSTPTAAPTTAPTTPDPNTNDLSKQDADVIQNLVMNKIKVEEMFTAFDITKQARNGGMRIFHEQVKNVIRDMHLTLANEDYTRTPMSMVTGKTAMVYHKIGADPEQYNLVSQLV